MGRITEALIYWAKEIGSVLIVILMCAGIGVIVTFSIIRYDVDMKITDQAAVINIIEPGLQVQRIAKDWADTHNYTFGVEVTRYIYDSNGTINGTETAIEGRYACDNFSMDLIQELENNGYEAEYCNGDALWCMPWETNTTCRHAWVKTYIYIEATSGRILDPVEYRTRYVEEDCRKLTP